MFRTERLTVRPWLEADDLPAIVRRIVGDGTDLPPAWQSVGDAEWIDEREGEGRVFLASTNRPVALLITDLPADGTTEVVHVGYVVDRSAAGQGLATELLTGFAAWAGRNGVDRLVAGVDPDNFGSVRVLEKAGFAVGETPFYVLELGGLPVIAGPRVVLRPWYPEDAEDLHRLAHDPVTRHWMAIEPYPLEAAESWIAELPTEWEERAAAHFVVSDGADGPVDGYLGLISTAHRFEELEVAYWVGPHARGRGLAAAALLTGLAWADEAFSPRRVLLETFVGNEASAKVARAAGFELVDTRPTDRRIERSPTEMWVFEHR